MKTNWNYYILQARIFVSKLFFIVILKLINSHGGFRSFSNRTSTSVAGREEGGGAHMRAREPKPDMHVDGCHARRMIVQNAPSAFGD